LADNSIYHKLMKKNHTTSTTAYGSVIANL